MRWDPSRHPYFLPPLHGEQCGLDQGGSDRTQHACPLDGTWQSQGSPSPGWVWTRQWPYPVPEDLAPLPLPKFPAPLPPTPSKKRIFYFVWRFRAAPAAYGGSQAGGRVRATAAGLHRSHARCCVCDLHDSSQQLRILNPVSEARDPTETSWFLVGFITAATLRALQRNEFEPRFCACKAVSFFHGWKRGL